MTPLEEKLRRQIRMTGPISVAEYMSQCLFDPSHGYYTSSEPFGADGDFTTAPEISQMFGEILAAWWQSSRQAIGIADLQLAEIGPGRGTLIDDMLRALGKLGGGSVPKAHLVEASPRLAARQRALLAAHPAEIVWHASPHTLPDAPLGIIANELFDAIPARQFVKTSAGWFERTVRIDSDDELAFGIGPAQIGPALLPQGHESELEGQVFEHAPARLAMMEMIARHVAAHGGFALLIDYGHAQSGFGDTLQAVRRHQFASVFHAPGQADLTSHVDFSALAKTAQDCGLAVCDTMRQGEFLTAAGINERAAALCAKGGADAAWNIGAALERLVSPAKMGSLFKVLGVASQKCDLFPLNFPN